MRGFSGQANAELGSIQADVGKIQQCLDICAQASIRIHRIRQTIRNVPKPSDTELVASPDVDRMTTLDVLSEFAGLLSSITTQIEDDVAVIHRRLDCFASHIQATKAARQEHGLEEIRLSTSSCSCNQPHPDQTNVFQAISATEDSQQIIVATSGHSICARDITTRPRSSQWLGQMSDASLQLLLRDVGPTHRTIKQHGYSS
jgi:hypothetical protein